MLLPTPHSKGVKAAESGSYISGEDAFASTMKRSEIGSPNYHEFLDGFNSYQASAAAHA